VKEAEKPKGELRKPRLQKKKRDVGRAGRNYPNLGEEKSAWGGGGTRRGGQKEKCRRRGKEGPKGGKFPSRKGFLPRKGGKEGEKAGEEV